MELQFTCPCLTKLKWDVIIYPLVSFVQINVIISTMAETCLTLVFPPPQLLQILLTFRLLMMNAAAR